MRNIATVVLIVFLYQILQRLTKNNLKFYLTNLVNYILNKIGNVNNSIHERNIQKSKISEKTTIVDSKYYNFIAQMIFNLSLINVTVEGLVSTIISISILANVILYTYTKNLFIFITGTPITAGFILIGLYITSNQGYFKKEYDLMEAEDLIITSLKDGVNISIQRNIEFFKPTVRPYFEEYLSNKAYLQMATDEALDILIASIGPSFYKFGEKLKEYDKTGKQGTLDTFKDDMKLNTMRRTDMLETEILIKESNTGYILALSLCLLLYVILFLAFKDVTNFFLNTGFGNLLLVAQLALALYGIVAVQRLREGL